METGTKVYTPRQVRGRASREVVIPRINLSGYSRDEIQSEIQRIKTIPASPGMNYRLALCVIVDLSGSMGNHLPMIKVMLKNMIEELSYVDNRDFTLDLILIHNSEAKTIYFGDARLLNISELLEQLPAPYGRTPYVDALTLGYNHMNLVYQAVEEEKQWFNPNGVVFSITDCLNNEGDGSEITKKLSSDILESRRTVAEFVTQLNKKGLCPGGYKIFIDQTNSTQQVVAFIRGLRVGSSSVNAIEGVHKVLDPRDRLAWNKFLGDRLAAEMAACYDRCIKPSYENY